MSINTFFRTLPSSLLTTCPCHNTPFILPLYLIFPPNPAFSSTPHYSFYPLISLHTLISAWHFPFFLRLPSQFPSNIICTLFGNDEGIHQLDSSDPILDLAPTSNLDGEQVKEMFVQSSTRSLEQSSWPCSSKSNVIAKLVDLVELQSKEGFRKHFKIVKPFRKLLKNAMKRR